MSHPAVRPAARGRRPYASVLLARNPSPMTLDGTNTWLLRRAGAAAAAWWSIPGRPTTATSARSPTRPGRSREILLTHGHLDHAEGAATLRRADRRAGAGARPGAAARRPRAWPRATWSPAAASRCGCWPRPGTPRDSLCFAAAGDGGADRRHRARPRHHRGRAPGRPARPTTSTRCSGCATGRRARRRARVLPGHGPVLPDLAAVLAYYLRAPAAAAGRRSARRSRPADATAARGGRRSSTPTSTRCCGRRPSCPSGLSWSTCAGEREVAAAAAPAPAPGSSASPRAAAGTCTGR